MKIVIVCAFFESGMKSFRENQFAERLAARGHDVTVVTSDQSYIWKRNRAGVASTDPLSDEDYYRSLPNLRVQRRSVWFRMGDLVLFPIHKADFENADVVHVLDFRQGVTAFAARMAKSLGVPVVYDHEQRGDRTGSPLHIFDNLVRRQLVRYGSSAPSLVRHTVMSNRRFFERVAKGYRGGFALSPLGVNDKVFFSDSGLRAATRSSLGIAEKQPLIVFTGKIDHDKRPADVAKAASLVNVQLYFAGKISESVRSDLAEFGNVRILGEKSQSELNALYNAADNAVFTTFSLSYWEALAAGANIVVPETEFSRMLLSDKPGVTLFGTPSMFEVEEERYRPEFDLVAPIAAALSRALDSDRADQIRHWLNWDQKINILEEQYREVNNERLG